MLLTYNSIDHVHFVFRRLEKNTKTNQHYHYRKNQENINLTKKKHVVHIYCKSDDIEQLKVEPEQKSVICENIFKELGIRKKNAL